MIRNPLFASKRSRFRPVGQGKYDWQDIIVYETPRPEMGPVSGKGVNADTMLGELDHKREEF
jgi:hypothetical protein